MDDYLFRKLQMAGLPVMGCWGPERVDFLRKLTVEEARVYRSILQRHEARGLLTAPQHQVLGYAAQGLANKQIGQRMRITARIVEYHLREARKRLKAQDRAQAVAVAIQSGILKI